jgi:hypothetical protein
MAAKQADRRVRPDALRVHAQRDARPGSRSRRALASRRLRGPCASQTCRRSGETYPWKMILIWVGLLIHVMRHGWPPSETSSAAIAGTGAAQVAQLRHMTQSRATMLRVFVALRKRPCRGPWCVRRAGRGVGAGGARIGANLRDLLRAVDARVALIRPQPSRWTEWRESQPRHSRRSTSLTANRHRRPRGRAPHARQIGCGYRLRNRNGQTQGIA